VVAAVAAAAAVQFFFCRRTHPAQKKNPSHIFVCGFVGRVVLGF
jgi:hypothetical protein